MSHLDDETIAALADRRLSPEAIANIEEHVDGCTSCRRLLSTVAVLLPSENVHADDAPAPADGDWLPKGTVVGRYVVVGRVGAGGMGVVYVAYDPELDRKVALKLLRATREDVSTRNARLIAEARAMARLSHRNVVAVFDAGTIDDRVFVAMELVEGETLSAWMKRAPRAWRDVRDVFLRAGEGLAAAHDASLVHRDFKPANVLVGADGRICVTDFGLARAADADAGDVVGGTPAYMAPEQRRGARADARSDQFAFAVALHEALYGERRPTDASVRRRDVPAWLRDVVLRGLAEEPAGRFESMGVMLAALGRDPARARVRIVAGLALAAALVVAGGAIARARAPAERQCAGSESSLVGVWDDARRAAVERAFLASGKPYAPAAWTEVRARLDAYTADWARMRTESCEATRVRGEQPDEVFALRTACLDRRLAEVDALATVFARGEARVVENAPGAAHALTSLAECRDTSALLARVTPPDAAIAPRVEALRIELARSKARRAAGAHVEARDSVTSIVVEARALAYRPLLAEALLQLGLAQSSLSEYRAAVATLREAVWNAEASRADGVAADSWTSLAAANLWLPDLAQAREAIVRADAAIARVGGAPPAADELSNQRGQLLVATGEFSAAIDEHRRHLADLEQRSRVEDEAIASTLGRLATALRHRGDFADAAIANAREASLRAKTRGVDHPAFARALRELGIDQLELARYDEARESLARSLAIDERAYGEGHTKTVWALVALGTTLDRLGRWDEARAMLERAVAIETTTWGERHPSVAYALVPLAEALLRHGDVASAETYARRAVDSYARAVGPDHFMTLGAGVVLGEAELARGDTKTALGRFERALAYRNTHEGPDAEKTRAENDVARAHQRLH